MMKNFDIMGKDLALVERRAVQVHGAAYAAFLAAVELFGGLLPQSEAKNFQEFVYAKCGASEEEAEQGVNVTRFWMQLLSAVRRGVFGETAPELQRFFKAHGTPMDHPPDAAAKDGSGNYIQGSWTSYVFYIELHAVLDTLKKDAAQRRETVALEYEDLKEQMSRRPYYSAKNLRTGVNGDFGGPKQRFGGGKPVRCIAIEVDKMEELGYRPVPDEVLLASKVKRKAPELPGAAFPTDPSWDDPRKGDLFTLIEMVDDTGEK